MVVLPALSRHPGNQDVGIAHIQDYHRRTDLGFDARRVRERDENQITRLIVDHRLRRHQSSR